jgi:hypothetical protein
VPEWLCYQFPKPLLESWLANGKGWGGKYVGQAQRWFFFRFTGDDSEVDLNAHGTCPRAGGPASLRGGQSQGT